MNSHVTKGPAASTTLKGPAVADPACGPAASSQWDQHRKPFQTVISNLQTLASSLDEAYLRTHDPKILDTYHTVVELMCSVKEHILELERTR